MRVIHDKELYQKIQKKFLEIFKSSHQTQPEYEKHGYRYGVIYTHVCNKKISNNENHWSVWKFYGTKRQARMAKNSLLKSNPLFRFSFMSFIEPLS